MTAVALTIAGSDPSGGAGIQADLKTFHQHSVYGTAVVSLLTVQNTLSVKEVQVLEPDFIIAQLSAVIEDIPPQAAKTGALGNAKVISALAEVAKNFNFPLVVDPVMISKHGHPLLDRDGAELLKNRLLSSAFLVTPNIPEAAALSGLDVTDIASMERAALKISQTGVRHVLIKGGHLEGDSVDILWSNGEIHCFSNPRIETKNTHGTGCVLSAAITANLALGKNIIQSVEIAKKFVTQAILTAPNLGRGQCPINLWAVK